MIINLLDRGHYHITDIKIYVQTATHQVTTPITTCQIDIQSNVFNSKMKVVEEI